ncbi:MAG TPA: hypothetical protein PKE64_08990 [Anaerolineae bacterium]|nr:hypothetical protein [Anaerolineae bacterium]HMR64132.1 hypothetical protein [Anaerolineae bacterium]
MSPAALEATEDSPLQPDVAVLLDVDAEYRRKAAAGKLRRIAPHRFNPTGEAWLPVMNTRRLDWLFLVLFANTAQAHKLNATLEWVIIFFEQDGQGEDQCTVVTEQHGSLAGKRVIRSRMPECRAYYAAQSGF